jgi:cytochrome oxidase Cu insertion factor (SCO1/SenC/PrrC family)
MSKIPLIALMLVVVLAGVGLALVAARPSPAAPVAPQLPTPAPDTSVRPFELLAHTGKPFTDRDLHGKVALLYFGYTFCPDVCPTELGFVAKIMRALGPDAERIVPLFITVDPQRDTLAKLAEYVPLFDKRLIGLTGSQTAIDALAKAYGVFHQRTNVVTKQPGYYLIDHSSSIFVLNPEGHFVDTFDSDTAIPTAVGRIVRLLPPRN